MRCFDGSEQQRRDPHTSMAQRARGRCAIVHLKPRVVWTWRFSKKFTGFVTSRSESRQKLPQHGYHSVVAPCELTRHLDTQLGTIKAECDGGASQESFYPSLSRCRLIAMTKRANGRRLVHPSWTPLVLDDVVDSDGAVAVKSVICELRREQLTKSKYERNRTCSAARASTRKRNLDRSLLGRAGYTFGGAV